jgi:hypothetical protein
VPLDHRHPPHQIGCNIHHDIKIMCLKSIPSVLLRKVFISLRMRTWPHFLHMLRYYQIAMSMSQLQRNLEIKLFVSATENLKHYLLNEVITFFDLKWRNA